MIVRRFCPKCHNLNGLIDQTILLLNFINLSPNFTKRITFYHKFMLCHCKNDIVQFVFYRTNLSHGEQLPNGQSSQSRKRHQSSFSSNWSVPHGRVEKQEKIVWTRLIFSCFLTRSLRDRTIRIIYTQLSLVIRILQNKSSCLNIYFSYYCITDITYNFHFSSNWSPAAETSSE